MNMAASAPKKHSNHIRQSRNDRWAKILAYTIVGVFGLVCLYPLVLTLTVSFTPEDVVNRDGFRLIPRSFTTASYQALFVNGRSFGRKSPDDAKGVLWEGVMLRPGENEIEVVSTRFREFAHWRLHAASND